MTYFTDSALSQEIRTAHPETIADTVRLMEKIEKALPPDDGIWCFNHLYLLVTRELEQECKIGEWNSPAWMETLVIEFAHRYFHALWLWLRGERKATPRAWRTLFRARHLLRKEAYSQIQFALIGVNVHINRDLPFASLWACRRHGVKMRANSPEYQDYVRVNKILERVEVNAMRALTTGWMKVWSDRIHPLDRVAAMILIKTCRWLAWRTGQLYAFIGKRSRRASKIFVRTLDGLVGVIGYLFLLPTYSR